MLYPLLKTVHVGSVLSSGALFVLRVVWAFLDAPQRRRRWVRIVPHVVDTVLLVSALGLLVLLGQYPFRNAWLTAKILGLLAYILLGETALRFSRTSRQRAIAFAGALAVFLYIVGVAMTHDPRSFSRWI